VCVISLSLFLFFFPFLSIRLRAKASGDSVFNLRVIGGEWLQDLCCSPDSDPSLPAGNNNGNTAAFSASDALES